MLSAAKPLVLAQDFTRFVTKPKQSSLPQGEGLPSTIGGFHKANNDDSSNHL